MAKKRRTRTDHRGVTITRRTLPSGKVSYVACRTDSDTGKPTQQSLTKLGLTSNEARREWAKRKARQRNKRLQEIASGAPQKTGRSLAEAVEIYFETAGSRRSKETVRGYRRGSRRFLEWAAKHNVKSADELRPHHLAQFREWLAVQPRQARKKGGVSGEHEITGELRKPATLNTEIRGVKAVVNHLRKVGELPLINRDARPSRVAAGAAGASRRRHPCLRRGEAAPARHHWPHSPPHAGSLRRA